MKQQSPKSTRRVAVCAMLCALGVVLLYLGSLIEVLDISMAVIASLFAVFAVIEYGGAYPWLVYAVTSVLSLLLLPSKLPALLYAGFFGYYPILKEKIERRMARGVGFLCKLGIFLLALGVMLFMSVYLLSGTDTLFAVPMLVAIFAGLACVTFVVYDLALTRLITLYLYRLRDRFRRHK